MSHETPAQPNLSDLMAGYLNRQAEAHAAGLATFDPSGEVLPFEAGPVQAVDPRPAWQEAIAVAPFFNQGVETRSWPTPPDWPQLVAAQEPAVALAFCLGNYPQLVRDLHLILRKADLADLRPQEGPNAAEGRNATEGVPYALLDWSQQVARQKQFPQTLLAAGALRLAQQFERAAEYLDANSKVVPQEWRAAWANEKAALAWHRGHGEEASGLWQQQQTSVPVLFNRGMSALFLGQRAPAQTALAEAVAQLPEAGAWHHLGRLYLALAQ